MSGSLPVLSILERNKELMAIFVQLDSCIGRVLYVPVGGYKCRDHSN